MPHNIFICFLLVKMFILILIFSTSSLILICYLLILLILQITQVYFLFSLKDSIQIRTDEGKKVKLRAPGSIVMIRNVWSLNVWYKTKHEKYKLLAKALWWS